MRKLIWGCAVGGVCVVSGAFAAAHHAVRHPQSFIGRALHGASHVAACANPYNGLAPVLAQLKSLSSVNGDEVAVEVDGLPEEPAPTGAADAPVASGPIEAPQGPAPIVIPETERPTEAAPVEVFEVPASEGLVAPATMPLVGDAEESELPMPAAEVEVECRSWWQTVRGWFETKEWAQETTTFKKTDCDELTVPIGDPAECREDSNYHHHYPGCPYTGRPFCGGQKDQPVGLPPLPMKNKGGEEPSEEGPRSSALKAIRKIKSRMSIPEDRHPVAPGVDTMELRKSDLSLSDYGPGPL